jgi:hypothetical protein
VDLPRVFTAQLVPPRTGKSLRLTADLDVDIDEDDNELEWEGPALIALGILDDAPI